jgi:recombination protein RecA
VSQELGEPTEENLVVGIDPAEPGSDRSVEQEPPACGLLYCCNGAKPAGHEDTHKIAKEMMLNDSSEPNPHETMGIKKPKAAKLRPLKKKKSEAQPPELKNARSDLRERMNARLRAKGLPLIMEKPEVYRFVATGIPQLDSLTCNMDVAGIGGLPRKHITEIYGPKGSGKSSLVKSIYKENPGLNILFFDAEGGLTAPPEGIDVVKGTVVEDIMTTMIEMVQAQAYDLIILDSVASLVTKKQFEDDPEGKAAMARAFGPLVKRLVAHMQPLGEDGYPSEEPGAAIVFINQFRSTTQSFGLREYTVGGKALEYYASLRLEMRSAKADYIIRNGKLAGQQVRVKVEKTRWGEKDVEVKYPIMFDELRDFDDFYINRLKEMGLR